LRNPVTPQKHKEEDKSHKADIKQRLNPNKYLWLLSSSLCFRGVTGFLIRSINCRATLVAKSSLLFLSYAGMRVANETVADL
jgi:hypothetical protein